LRGMEHVVMVRLDWDRTAPPRICPRGFYACHVDPEPGHPFGRKGLQLAAAWDTLAGPAVAGMVILDGDVAIDPQDLAAMLAAIELEPGAVHVAPVRLWPASTKQARWVWGHGRGGFSRDDPDDPDTYGFSFTYLPRRLVEACIRAGLHEWAYPHVDARARQVSQRMGLAVRVVRAASPKHLNY
jgi:hypothetical protein